MSLLLIGLASLATVLATGLGALPLLAKGVGAGNWMGAGTSIAAGLMAGATALLIVEGVDRSYVIAFIGMIAGFIMVMVGQRVLPMEDDNLSVLAHGADRNTLLLVVLMTVHSAAEGIGVGVSFGGGERLGLSVTTAIALHNIPEGLAISLVLVGQGASVLRAALWSIATSIPQVILAVPAYIFVEQFRSVLPLGLGFAAGAMIWMIVYSLIPEAREKSSNRSIASWMLGSALCFIAVQTLI